ncbi:tRNA (N(6)-L-threonylcarbamoyladenosine(37)-C(2))-methylthiotransferase MtaB [Candidatus Marinamargulisbacteria bacterium SCGC AG-410-N11]|nr:tRNA (N(6)-L-threonylcarbamoyladenosine(37)-C(2))-methylthiotransferase MtaB [Candidatus Marinamargulisbacteria bacterium SCGC AG-410-N11]
MKKQRVALVNQGCRLNQAETASLEHSFIKQGHQIVDLSDSADVVVVNTCTVTERGDGDTRRLVNKIVRINNKTDIALIGCQSQILKEKLLQLPNVKWVIGNKEKMNVSHIISQDIEKQYISTPKILREPFKITEPAVDRKHQRANIKIQDGCDHYCSFCVIPFARGPARSREFDNIISEVTNLVSAGHQEVVVTGINLGTYDYKGKNIVDVIDSIAQVDGLRRVRISSIEPTTIPDGLIELFTKHNNLCPFFHIPIQSGCDKTLSDMARKYKLSEYKALLDRVISLVPDACIGTDVIVGFPGESEDDFETTVFTLLTLPIHYFHVFSYSQRLFARSRKLSEKVLPAKIKARSQRLRDISLQKRNTFCKRFLDTKQDVLFEQEKNGFWVGLTEHYVKVKVKSEMNLKNQFRTVIMTTIEDDTLIGTIV